MEFLLVLIIPLMIAIVCFILFKEISWKEFLIHIAVQVFITTIFIFIIFYQNVYYTEVWNGEVVSKERVEVSCRHSYPCNPHSCMCDNKGNCSTCWDTCYTHSYDVDWRVYDNTKQVWDINTVDSQGLIKPLRWEVVKNGDPTAHTHSYKNYIKASKQSLFHLQGQLTEKYKKYLPAYPMKIYDYYNLNRIVTVGVKLPNKFAWNYKLAMVSSKLGKTKQCNAILVLVNNQPEEYYYALGQHWEGGNKNDAILVISVDDANTIQWANVIALVTNNIFNVQLRDSILDMKTLDMEKVLVAFEENIEKNFKRKRMRDFDYLMSSITPSTAQLITVIILGTIISVGLSIFFHKDVTLN
jgi:hypothetical protein